MVGHARERPRFFPSEATIAAVSCMNVFFLTAQFELCFDVYTHFFPIVLDMISSAGPCMYKNSASII